jgi:large conductance mechanosensitive channel
MNLTSEFKEFVARGNVVDLAVGVVMGTAFGKIVSSLVADVIMPPVGLLIGGVNFAHLKVTLREGVDKTPPVTLNYGLFLQSILDFLLIALTIFALVKIINKVRRTTPQPPPPPAPPTQEVVLLTEIRDALVTGPPPRR